MPLIIAIGLDVIALIVLLKDSNVKGITKFLAVVLTATLFIPDPLPYVDEILLSIMVARDPAGAAKFLTLCSIAVEILLRLP